MCVYMRVWGSEKLPCCSLNILYVSFMHGKKKNYCRKNLQSLNCSSYFYPLTSFTFFFSVLFIFLLSPPPLLFFSPLAVTFLGHLSFTFIIFTLEWCVHICGSYPCARWNWERDSMEIPLGKRQGKRDLLASPLTPCRLSFEDGNGGVRRDSCHRCTGT